MSNYLDFRFCTEERISSLACICSQANGVLVLYSVGVNEILLFGNYGNSIIHLLPII
ncbi:uncharacterized protein DS421_15g499890 [Arachis hypogaea]|nr:uncharacterized protein DS421_15g499890 [Arachis hypogaea]